MEADSGSNALSIGLLQARTHLISTKDGFLSWLRQHPETPAPTTRLSKDSRSPPTSIITLSAHQSILRKPRTSSPRKRQCFYASPITGGPVESVHRYEVPSPFSNPGKYPSLKEAYTTLQQAAPPAPASPVHNRIRANAVKEAALRREMKGSDDHVFADGDADGSQRQYKASLSQQSSHGDNLGSAKIGDRQQTATYSGSAMRYRSQSPLSSDSDSESEARRRWYPSAIDAEPLTRPLTKSPPALATLNRDLILRPRGKVVKRSTSDSAILSSGRLVSSQRRVSHRQRASQDQIYDKLARLQLESEGDEAIERERERVIAEAERQKKEQAEWERRAYRIVPSQPVIAPLSEEWERRLSEAMAAPPNRALATAPDGTTLTRHDFGTLYPQKNSHDGGSAWLNDEIINTSMQHIIAYALDQTNYKRGMTPKFHAFASQFYSNLSTRGPQSVARWAKRAKIGGSDLLKVDYVFIPVNPSVHWTLLVVMPTRKLVEYFDSYHDDPTRYLELAESWLEMELAPNFVANEWTFRSGFSPSQTNARDCGVFLVTTAKMVMLGLDPEKAYSEKDLALQRKRIACELMNGGFSGDFEPLECGEPGIAKKSRSRRGSTTEPKA